MKVLVTGGTGYVGGVVVDALLRHGHQVRLLIRTRTALLHSASASKKVEAIEGTLSAETGLHSALEGIDAVIHLVGIISEVGANTFRNVHTHATQNLVRACRRAGVDRFVHMSALGTRPNAVSAYHVTKWEAEEAVRGSRLRYTIFRPSLIVGASDHVLSMFARISRFSPFLPVIGDGQTRFQPVSVQDVAMAFVGCLAEPRSEGQVLELCGPEIFSFNEILDQLMAALGRRRRRLHLPIPLARLLAQFLEVTFPVLLSVAPPLNRAQLIMLQEDHIGDPFPAVKLLGLPLLPLQSVLKDLK